MPQHEAHPVVIEQLSGGQCREAATKLGGECRGLSGVVDRQQRDRPPGELGNETEPHPRDDGQGALGSGKQRRQGVAGVVLHKPWQAPDDRAVRQDRLDSHDLLPHDSVAQDVHAAGVGGDHATDRCRVARAHVHAEIPAGTPSMFLESGERDARTNGDLPGDLIDGFHLPETQRR